MDSGNGLTSWFVCFWRNKLTMFGAHCPVNSLTQLAESKVTTTKRVTIENFLDDKSAGLQLESGEICDTDALARLGLILATVTLYLVNMETAVVALGLRHAVDTHWQRGLSYFKSAGAGSVMRLLPFFWLEPGPDPYPAM